MSDLEKTKSNLELWLSLVTTSSGQIDVDDVVDALSTIEQLQQRVG